MVNHIYIMQYLYQINRFRFSINHIAQLPCPCPALDFFKFWASEPVEFEHEPAQEPDPLPLHSHPLLRIAPAPFIFSRFIFACLLSSVIIIKILVYAVYFISAANYIIHVNIKRAIHNHIFENIFIIELYVISSGNIFLIIFLQSTSGLSEIHLTLLLCFNK